MRDGALWIMLIIGALAIGPGWMRAWEALQVEAAALGIEVDEPGE